MASKYDNRNKLNDLTGREWLLLTKSFWFTEKCGDDKDAFRHPAPFLIKDIEKLISMFTKKGMVVLDPFLGSGTTCIAAYNLGRIGVGMDLSQDYKDLAIARFDNKNMVVDKDYRYYIGDSATELQAIGAVDYIVTSPPYHNILRNKNSGIRKDNSDKGYRSGSRIGVEYYSDDPHDLGNQDSFEAFIDLLEKVMRNCYAMLRNKKYCSIIISDFTVDRQERCVQADIISMMQRIGFKFAGTTVLLQDNKPLYPFGYPFAYKINHMHQNIINFRKDE